MRGAWAIAKRELRSYFHSPVGYVAIAGFLAIRGVFFAAQLISLEFARGNPTQEAPDLAEVVRAMFAGDLFWALLIIVPLLTMRTLAEERSQQTAPVILTAPVGTAQVVFGKFLGAFLVLVVMVVLATNMPAVVVWYGQTGLLPVISGVISSLFLGALLVGVGLLASSLTESQFVAALLGLTFNLALYLTGTMVTRIPLIGGDLDQFSIINNLDQLGRGVLDTAPLVFFFTGTWFFLFLTTRVVESQRWR